MADRQADWTTVLAYLQTHARSSDVEEEERGEGEDTKHEKKGESLPSRMSSSSGLVVPISLWGRQAPTHCISVLYLLRDQKTLITGGSDGQILLWEVDVNGPNKSNSNSHHSNSNGTSSSGGGGGGEWGLTPRHLLVGHTAPVKCIAKASSGQDCHQIVSSSENGEMFTWDTVDGRVIESKKYSHHVHTTMQVKAYFPQ